MSRIFTAVVLILILLPACSNKTGSTKTVVKPKYHHRWFDRKKDRRTKRTKTVRVQQ